MAIQLSSRTIGCLLWAFNVPVGLSGCGYTTNECSPGGCYTRASLQVFFDGKLPDVVGGETEVCVDFACEQIVWSSGGVSEGSFQGAFGNEVTLDLSKIGTSSLVVTLTFGQFADGEERRVEIRMLDGSGATALTLDRTVVFDRYESCGDICVSGPQPVDLRGMSDAGAGAEADANDG